MKIILILMALVFSQLSLAQTMSKTCSGRMRYCDTYGICSQEHFYLYAYQTVSLDNNGNIRHHRYNLRTRSILGAAQDYIPRDIVYGDFIVYDGPNFSLAIPWNQFLPIYYFQPNFGVPEWQQLCR